ncbi:MAG TPA: hypothetical protein VML55_04870, partial [Planctomycetaceae bacterium]|nr:hypothetical protein [Planctomycetaceae bacterium]
FELLEGPMPPLKYLGDPGWSPGRSGAAWQDVSSAGIGKPEPLTEAKYQSRYHLAIRDFLDAIVEDRDPLDGPEPARDVVEMIAAVFESNRRGGPVRLPLEERRHPLSLPG